MPKQEVLSPITTKESAKGILEFYFDDGWTIEHYKKDLARLLHLAKQSPEWDENKDMESYQVIDDIVTSSFLIFN